MLASLSIAVLAIAHACLAQEDVDNVFTQTLPSLLASSDNNGVSYKLLSHFGYNLQTTNLRVDIAQPYVWVVSAEGHTVCNTTNTTDCISNGVYNASSSQTSIEYADYQSLSFFNGIDVNGSIVGDEASFFSANENDSDSNGYVGWFVDNLHFIDVNATNIGIGGLGLSGQNPDSPLFQYENMTFLDTMKSNGRINSSSYSFFAHNNQFLSLTFGGLNPNQFINDLVVFDQIPFKERSTSAASNNLPIVPLTRVSVVNANGNSVVLGTDEYPVLLDSRLSYSLLPYQTLINLAIQLSAYYSYDDNIWFAKCAIGDLGATLGFHFGNLTIQVPVSNFLRPLTDDDDNLVMFDDGDQACILSVRPNNGYGYSALGTNFLRSAFLAVDNENNQIALAQAYNDFYQNQTAAMSVKPANATKVITTSIPFESSLIQSGTIPFAVGHNLTSIYSDFTFSVNNDYTPSSVPPDITARMTHGTIYTGRVGISVISESATASELASTRTMMADGFRLSAGTGMTIMGLLMSWLL